MSIIGTLLGLAGDDAPSLLVELGEDGLHVLARLLLTGNDGRQFLHQVDVLSRAGLEGFQAFGLGTDQLLLQRCNGCVQCFELLVQGVQGGFGFFHQISADGEAQQSILLGELSRHQRDIGNVSGRVQDRVALNAVPALLQVGYQFVSGIACFNPVGTCLLFQCMHCDELFECGLVLSRLIGDGLQQLPVLRFREAGFFLFDQSSNVRYRIGYLGNVFLIAALFEAHLCIADLVGFVE